MNSLEREKELGMTDELLVAYGSPILIKKEQTDG